MLEQVCNIFTKSIFCITTNGIVKSNGELVMGAGVALEAKKRYPNLPYFIGLHVREKGNIPGIFNYYKETIISFPTKDHFKNKSNIDLIINSARDIVIIANMYKLNEIYLTRPGCGLGGLDWNYVRDKISPILDNRFIVCTPK